MPKPSQNLKKQSVVITDFALALKENLEHMAQTTMRIKVTP
jgi:hypothetical protein